MFGSGSSFNFLAVWAGVIALVSMSSASAFASEKPEIFVQKGHSGEVKYLALSPDEELLLSISDWKGEEFISPAVRLWDVKSKRIFKDIKVKEKVMFFLDYQAGFSSDGRFVYFWGDDKQIFIYNIREDTYRKFDLTKYFSDSQLNRASGDFSVDISDKSITIHLQPDDTDDDDVEVVKIVDAGSGKLVTEVKNKNQSMVRQKKKALRGRGISPLEVILSRDGSQFYSLEKEQETMTSS